MNLAPTRPAAAPLGRRTAAPEQSRAGQLVDAVLGARVHIDVEVPRTGIRAKMRLLGAAELDAAAAEARTAMTDGGFPTSITARAELGGSDAWNRQMVIRQLAIAVRDPADVSRPLATLEEWQSCDEGQLGTLWTRLQDLEAELNPLGAGVELSESEFAEIADAAKKKALPELLSFGSLKLARFITTSADQPAS